MRDDFRMALETPSDRLVTDRAQFFSGCFEGHGPFRLRASCGDIDLPVREFTHPGRLARRRFRGFWGVIALQDFVEGPRRRWLDLDFHWGDDPVARVRMAVSPTALEVARRCPLNRKRYRIFNHGRPSATRKSAPALVFPGLGGVGGSSLNTLMRLKMLENGWETPIRGEANDPPLWAKLCRERPSEARWIDGHGCHAAGKCLAGPWARITLLREPEARLLSLFNWGLLATPRGFRHSSFDDFIHSPDIRGFTMAEGLLRMAGWTPPPDAKEEELFREARAELRRSYALVGVTEYFEESVFLICSLAGHDEIGMWWRFLSAPAFARHEDISSASARKLKEVTAVDRRLYEECMGDFLEGLGKVDFGESLQEYKRDAANQPQLTDSEKLAECLRWRQLLAEDELGALRAQVATGGRR